MPLYLALDPGKLRVGVAISDASGTLACPLAVIPRKPHGTFIQAIRTLFFEHSPDFLVVGLPLQLDGTVGKEAQRALSLASELATLFNIQVFTEDESYSTSEALEILTENHKNPSKRTPRVDQVSAAVILQRFLHKKLPLTPKV
ncbi:MAG: Holliday junction resolvase RuvX [Deltaproteobacteria bacterium]|jgi:putative Holliday junction resolvase|nr:Holliday junction resolvase RuvX [Deltaproteobacteria bacterium]